MSNLGQQILSTEGEITNIVTGALAIVKVAQGAIEAWKAAHPNQPVPEAWDDPVLNAAIATLKGDAAALVKHAQEVQARQQALDAEASGTTS